MVTAEIETELEIDRDAKALHESIFWEEDDPRWAMLNKDKVQQNKNGHDNLVVDMESDAYIWCYTGPRGAGKSLAMTYYAAKAVYLYDMRLVSNYPISFVLHRADGTSSYHEAEPLDFYRLLCFDKDYQHCLILIDEAPDVISHMSAMTWKNRLLNIFVRQLRKNMNSLFLGAQQFSLIDKSMRWQTDIVVRCQDAFRLYGKSKGLARGACILLDLYDNSGQWTGHAKNLRYDGDMHFHNADESLELPGKVIWGAYNTLHQQDVFESLKRVDMKLESYQVGGPRVDRDKMIRYAEQLASLKETTPKLRTTELWESLGVTPSEKNRMSTAWRHCGIERVGEGRRDYDISKFDMDAFLKTVLEEKPA